MLRLLIFFTFIFISGVTLSQRYTFLSYSTAQGLPQTQVTSIAQDERGFLWVGTLGGLARFNGKEFESFTSENGLLNNRVTFLDFIQDQLWIGHEGGVSRMGANGFDKWSFPIEERKTKVSDIIEYKGSIIVATNGAGLFKISGNKLIKIYLPSEDDQRIRDLEIYNGDLFVGTRGGLIHTSSPDLKGWKSQFTELNISSVKRYADKLYLTTFGSGLFAFDPISGKYSQSFQEDSLMALRSCYFDSNDRMWLNTGEGLWRLKEGKVELKLNESNGLPMEAIQSIFEDRNGDLWFGSEGKGLLRFTGERFIYYKESSGLSSDLILCVNQDKSGDFWFGTYDKGLTKLSPDRKFRQFDVGNNTVWCSLTDVSGMNWFGTGTGLFAMKGDKVVKEFFSEDGTPGDKITAMYKVDQNSFYIGGSYGVSLYKDGKISIIDDQNIESVRNFCKFNGELYCATDKGLFVIRNKKATQIGSFYSTVYSLVLDSNNKMWVGTEEGLYCYDGKKLWNVNFTSDAASNIINFLSIKGDELFVGTNNGLYLLKELSKKKPQVVKYGIGEGVVNLETNLNSSFVDRKGRFWFGTASGLVCFRQNYETGVDSPPSLVLKKILINYQELDFTKFSERIDKYGLPTDLLLPYSKNNISFELDGIALANYPGMKFQYKLEGLDGNWSPQNSSTNITFNALPAGSYVFHARCIDARGKFSSEITIPFVIRQAFYKSWWFILICSVLVGLAAFGVFRLRLKREREANEKERLEYRSKLLSLEQRSLNASMNRHFIFNSLNSIQYFINTQDKLSANKFLTNFAKLIRKNLDSSEEGNMVTLAQELERLDLYLSLESMRFKDKFDYKIECDPEIDKDSIVIPAMILQPFVENSIIHGILPNEEVKGHIEVKIRKEGNTMVINLTDNGIGIENSIRKKSDYDGDHKSQGMEITSKRIELLNKLSDGHFEIIGPFQIEDQYHSIKGTGVTLKIQLENLED